MPNIKYLSRFTSNQKTRNFYRNEDNINSTIMVFMLNWIALKLVQ